MLVKLTDRVSSFFPLLLAATAVSWTGLMVVEPQPAIAQTTVNSEILLEASEEESYKVFIARAEANAAVKVQSLFDQDLLRTEVRMTVLGQRSAVITPVLKLRVSRQEWTAYPDPEIWSIYYPEGKAFLFMEPATPDEPPADVDVEPPTIDPIEPSAFEDPPLDFPDADIPAEATEEIPEDTEASDVDTTEDVTEETEETATEEAASEETTETETESSSRESNLPSRTIPTLVR
ncbi:hypothetical protein Lepto7376_1175 [[Leptolyngbya] sp. PCC 7376]|uniref:hypothetical protein n=1 Tax=[Leptolyngbya] sp. PCC 7376 TaxID=111781 RepID=UPI00029ECFAE|nr:hypothetical protein [[Leptolyngbya] sp. PCC 7376]AFY37532.1 hypothetical protein Lepto7376_1175 [[Leptolyngbya] sp. PCC 7376]